LPSLDEISELVSSNEPRVQAALDSLHRPAQMAEQLDHPLRAPSMLRQDVPEDRANHGHVAGGSAPMLVGVAYWRLIDVKAAGASNAQWC